MKTCTTLLFSFTLIIALTFDLHAQSLTTPNNQWLVQVKYVNPSGNSYSLDTVRTAASVQLNGKNYTLLRNGIYGNDTLGYIREVGKQVFAKVLSDNGFVTGRDTSEFLLHDFGLSIGDTFYLREYAYFDASSELDTFQVVVKDSVNTVTGKRERLKLQHIGARTSSLPGGNYIDCYGDTLTWIEGIGSTIGVFYAVRSSGCQGFGEGNYYTLICQSTAGVLNYQPFNTCGTLSNSEVLLSQVDLFPNPNKGIFELNVSSEFYGLNLVIINSQGEEVFTHLVNNTSTKVALPNLANGIYCVLGKANTDKSLVVKKFFVVAK